ncbi:MAG: hypothetical protein GX424_07930 [Clostridiales bacterium]|nr:hypothetical protein [Clostridiales bacterium]
MKKLILAVSAALLAGGLAAAARKDGRPERIHGCGFCSAAVIGKTDGPSAVFVSGEMSPYTVTSAARGISAAVCRAAVGRLCMPRKRTP